MVRHENLQILLFFGILRHDMAFTKMTSKLGKLVKFHLTHITFMLCYTMITLNVFGKDFFINFITIQEI